MGVSDVNVVKEELDNVLSSQPSSDNASELSSETSKSLKVVKLVISRVDHHYHFIKMGIKLEDSRRRHLAPLSTKRPSQVPRSIVLSNFLFSYTTMSESKTTMSGWDHLYKVDKAALDAVKAAKPWYAGDGATNPKYFKTCYVSAAAAVKMLEHALRGVEKGMSSANRMPVEVG